MAVINTVTLWNREIREELMFPQTIKKFLAYFGTRSFNTVFATACHLILASVILIQSTSSSQFLEELLLSYHLPHSTLLDLNVRITYRGA